MLQSPPDRVIFILYTGGYSVKRGVLLFCNKKSARRDSNTHTILEINCVSWLHNIHTYIEMSDNSRKAGKGSTPGIVIRG